MKAQMFNISLWIEEVNPKTLKKEYENLLIKSGFQVVGFTEKYFSPQGYTALFLLAESHFAIHTFPEENKTYIELSSCVEDKFVNFRGLHDAYFEVLPNLENNK